MSSPGATERSCWTIQSAVYGTPDVWRGEDGAHLMVLIPGDALILRLVGLLNPHKKLARDPGQAVLLCAGQCRVGARVVVLERDHDLAGRGLLREVIGKFSAGHGRPSSHDGFGGPRPLCAPPAWDARAPGGELTAGGLLWRTVPGAGVLLTRLDRSGNPVISSWLGVCSTVLEVSADTDVLALVDGTVVPRYDMCEMAGTSNIA